MNRYLEQFIQSCGTARKAAARLGISPFALSRIRRGHTANWAMVAIKIEEATRGRIKAIALLTEQRHRHDDIIEDET